MVEFELGPGVMALTSEMTSPHSFSVGKSGATAEAAPTGKIDVPTTIGNNINTVLCVRSHFLT